MKVRGVKRRTGWVKVVTSRWRDNKNPFPGEITNVEIVRMSQRECAWQNYLRQLDELRNKREWARWQQNARLMEELVDQACEAQS